MAGRHAAARPQPRRRYAYALGYAMMAGAGIAAVYWPAPSVRAASGGAHLLPYLWAIFLVAGGVLALYGAVTDRWVGEYLGLPLLAAVFAVYAVAAFVAAWTSGRPSSLAGGLALGSIALLIVGRWRDVAAVRRRAALPPLHGGGGRGG